MVEVEVCKAKHHDWSDGKPVRLVVVEGCKHCAAADDELAEAMGSPRWRLPKAQTIAPRGVEA